ncbi:MAG TPA: hypothetical protein VGL81_07645 [Polyangiaceae bacterium]
MSACAYRSLEPVLRQRVAELQARREEDVIFVDMARRVAARRIGRAVGGGVGLCTAVAALAIGVVGFALDGKLGISTWLLFLAWPAALVSGVLARLVARPLLSLGEGGIAMSGNPSVDLVRLESTDPLRRACDLAMSWERSSAALPMAALSLLAPLSIHGAIWWIHAQPGPMADDFGIWIAVSMVIVGHAHIALLVCAVRWAYRLRSVETVQLRADLGRAWGSALLVSAGVACIPGIVLLAIPPILVLVTGLAFVPLMYHCTAGAVARERLALEAA